MCDWTIEWPFRIQEGCRLRALHICRNPVEIFDSPVISMLKTMKTNLRSNSGQARLNEVPLFVDVCMA